MNVIYLTLLFLDFSGGEFLLIGVVFLMFFGSKSIPGVARAIGKIIRQFRDAAGDVQREIQESANLNLKDFDLKNSTNADIKHSATTTLPPVINPPLPPTPQKEKPQVNINND